MKLRSCDIFRPYTCVLRHVIFHAQEAVVKISQVRKKKKTKNTLMQMVKNKCAKSRRNVSDLFYHIPRVNQEPLISGVVGKFF